MSAIFDVFLITVSDGGSIGGIINTPRRSDPGDMPHQGSGDVQGVEEEEDSERMTRSRSRALVEREVPQVTVGAGFAGCRKSG